MDTALIWIVTIVTIAISFTNNVNAVINMSTSPGTYVMSFGDTITMSCLFRAEGYNFFNTPLVWHKSQGHSTEEQEVMEMNYNKVLKSPFDTGRFQVHFTEEANSYLFTLTINDVKREDIGNYSCVILGERNTELARVTHHLIINLPVEKLVITDSKQSLDRISMHTSIRSLHFAQNEINHFRCLSIGGYPPPEMRIYVSCIEDNKQANKEITDQLEWSQIFKLSGEKGMRNITYLSMWSDLDFEVGRYFDGCEMVCAINVPNSRQEEYVMEQNAVMHIKYKPVIKCFNTTALPGDRVVLLTCDVYAKPEATQNQFFDNSSYEVAPSTDLRMAEYYMYTDENPDPKTNKVRHTLYMKVARVECFQTYTFRSQNQLGLTSHFVSLIRKIIPTPPRPTYTKITFEPKSDPWINNAAASFTLPGVTSSVVSIVTALIITLATQYSNNL